MKWIEIDTNNLPRNEVLAANFGKGTFGYKDKLIGYLRVSNDGKIFCETKRSALVNCTHYIDINKFSPE